MLLAAICVLMFYWSFLASPVLPEERFPSSSSALSTCVQSCICCVVIFICLICLLKRAQKVERISRVATVVSLVVLCMLAVALIILSLVGVEPPNVLFIAFPVAVGFCGFFVTLRIAKVMRSMDGGEIVIAVLGSMPFGLFVGVAVPSVFPLAGLTATSSCYPMLIVAGVISLLPFGLSNRQETDFASRREGATAKYMPLVVMLLLYLFASAAFMGTHVAATSGVWFTDNPLHFIVGLLLYVLCALYAVAEYRGSERFRLNFKNWTGLWFWVAFALLLTVFLYCVALLNPDHSDLCAELILPSRPLAMTLLMLLAFLWGSGLDGRSNAIIVSSVLSAIMLINAFADVLAVDPLIKGELALIVNLVALATAFAMTACVIVWIAGNMKKGEGLPATQNESPESQGVERIHELAESFGLTRREREVMTLLAQGNTQKRVAEDLGLSLNSVQTYAKSLYRKLDIHSRQELIDLLGKSGDSSRPRV